MGIKVSSVARGAAERVVVCLCSAVSEEAYPTMVWRKWTVPWEEANGRATAVL